jgi:ubiquinone biosynthesis protein COQ9
MKPEDMTLAELRLELAADLAAAAVFDGWSKAGLDSVAAARGLDPALVHAAFSGGPMAMIAAWTGSIDAAMAQALPADHLAALPIRERIRRLVQFRLDAAGGQEEALRRALAIMAMPHHAAGALRLGWRSADAMWRLAGDRASDFNHYTKRTILAAIYAATLAVFVDDKSEGKADSRAFLDRRIAGVMRFEQVKARMLRPDAARFNLARLAGRLRYPAR